jgi:hypothetical protein
MPAHDASRTSGKTHGDPEAPRVVKSFNVINTKPLTISTGCLVGTRTIYCELFFVFLHNVEETEGCDLVLSSYSWF